MARSSDGGATWTNQNIFSRVDLLSLAFADDKKGAMTDANGSVWLTGDGGTTWLPFNVRTGPRLASVYLSDAFTGWAVGENGLILRTERGRF